MCTFFHNISQIGIFCALLVPFTQPNIPIITQNFRFIFQQVMHGAGKQGRTEAREARMRGCLTTNHTVLHE